MKIVMTVSNPFKPDPRVYKEAKSLVKAGHEVYVIAWDREGKYAREEVKDGIRIIRVGPRSTYGYKMAIRLPIFYLNALKIILRLKPDVLHTHDFDTAVLGFLLKLFRVTKWVYDVHDLYEDFVRSPFVSRVILAIDSILIKNANVIISVNHMMSRILRLWGSRREIVVIMNTIDPLDFPMPKKIPKENKGKFTVFYGGVLSNDRFIEEMATLSEELNFRFEVAGFGYMEEKIKKIPSVVFLGYLSHNEAIRRLGGSDLTFILTDPRYLNNKIASSNKLFEAMYVGTPILVIRGTLPEELAPKFAIPVEYSMDQIRDTLRVLIENPKLLKKKSFIGKRLFFKRYLWSRMEYRLKELYRRLGE